MSNAQFGSSFAALIQMSSPIAFVPGDGVLILGPVDPFVLTPEFYTYSKGWTLISRRDAEGLRYGVPHVPPPWQGYIIPARLRGHSSCGCMLSERRHFILPHHPMWGQFPVSWVDEEILALQFSFTFPQYEALGRVSYGYRDPCGIPLHILLRVLFAARNAM